jgi:hypothetical protein
MPSPDHHRIVDAAWGPASARASVPESDGGTRLSFPSRDPGRSVFQPNVVVGLCHGRVPLRAPGPRPVDRWTSRAPPRYSPRPYVHINAALFMATRIAFMVYSLSLTGMRRPPLSWRNRSRAPLYAALRTARHPLASRDEATALDAAPGSAMSAHNRAPSCCLPICGTWRHPAMTN